MKILRLQSNNVMRLVAVDITPAGDMVIVGGKNGAGKSSVLNSIAMALGGQAMCPAEPIRAGEREAKIVVDLGDLVVTRKFSRDQTHQPDCAHLKVSGPHDERAVCNCTPTFGETRSTLTVTNKDGARYPSPQAVLDRLLGTLTFDPLAFARDDAKRQAETLRQLVGLDTTAVEERRKEAFACRAMLKKTHAIKAAQLAALPFVKGAPDAEIPMEEVTAEMARAEELRKAAEEAERAVARQKDSIATATTERAKLGERIKDTRARIEELQKALDLLDSEQATVDTSIERSEATLVELRATALAVRAAVPDAEELKRMLSNAEKVNGWVRANRAYVAAQSETERLLADIETKHQAVLAADEAKRAALAAVTFPVEGLGLSDDGVTFGGLPFAQASSSEQLRVSVAIGLALNPTLKVLLVRSGNLLDDDSLRAVGAQAEAAGAQVWVEWVTADAEGVSVMIEEGRVAK